MKKRIYAILLALSLVVCSVSFVSWANTSDASEPYAFDSSDIMPMSDEYTDLENATAIPALYVTCSDLAVPTQVGNGVGLITGRNDIRVTFNPFVLEPARYKSFTFYFDIVSDIPFNNPEKYFNKSYISRSVSFSSGSYVNSYNVISPNRLRFKTTYTVSSDTVGGYLTSACYVEIWSTLLQENATVSVYAYIEGVPIDKSSSVITDGSGGGGDGGGSGSGDSGGSGTAT